MRRLLIAAVGLARSRRMTPVSRCCAVIILALTALFAGGCRLLGVAELTPLDPGSEPSVLKLLILEGDPGDSWPREGEVLFWLSGSQVPIESLRVVSDFEGSLELHGQDRGCAPEALGWHDGDTLLLFQDYRDIPWTAEDASDGRVDINLFAVLPKVGFAPRSYWVIEQVTWDWLEQDWCGQANWVS
jgi:hypothetical protein